MHFFIVSFVASLLGMAYLVFGKKQGRMIAMLAGAGLCGYSYFIDSLWVLYGIGAVLAIAPFLYEVE